MSDRSNPQDDFNTRDHLGKLKPGAVLLARDMSDPNFNATAVLICQHGPEGSYGLVLNRPSHMPLSEVFDKPPAWAGDAARKQRIYIGGPVQPEELQILQVTTEPVPGSYQVAPEVYLGGYWGDLKDVLDLEPKALRLFLGYSGWGADQLAKEVELKAWEVWKVDVKKLLLGPEEAWQGGLGPIKTFLSTL
jgi:putative transcriptional regulator